MQAVVQDPQRWILFQVLWHPNLDPPTCATLGARESCPAAVHTTLGTPNDAAALAAAADIAAALALAAAASLCAAIHQPTNHGPVRWDQGRACRERGEKRTIRCCSTQHHGRVCLPLARQQQCTVYDTRWGGYTAQCDGTGAGRDVRSRSRTMCAPSWPPTTGPLPVRGAAWLPVHGSRLSDTQSLWKRLWV